MGKSDFHGSLGQALPLPSRAPYGKTLERVPEFSYLGVVLEENLSCMGRSRRVCLQQGK